MFINVCMFLCTLYAKPNKYNVKKKKSDTARLKYLRTQCIWLKVSRRNMIISHNLDNAKQKLAVFSKKLMYLQSISQAFVLKHPFELTVILWVFCGFNELYIQIWLTSLNELN